VALSARADNGLTTSVGPEHVAAFNEQEEAAMTKRADVKRSAAFEVLRPSSRKLLAYVEREIERAGGGNVTLFNDQLEKVGSRNIYVPGLSELNALGLLRVVRMQKRHLISLSDGWRTVSKQDAVILSARARVRRQPVLTSQSATASSNAQA
jgi:hypothetical protein